MESMADFVARHFAYTDKSAETAPTRERAQAAGYHVQNAGGDCLVWERELPGGDVLWICTEDNTIDANAEAADWIVGRHSKECGFVQINEPMTFGAALEVVAQLPSPVQDGEDDQITYETVADFKAGKPKDWEPIF